MFDFPVWVIVHRTKQRQQSQLVGPSEIGEIYLSQKEAVAHASGEFQPRAIGSYRGLLVWAERSKATGLKAVVSRRGIRSDPPIDLHFSTDDFIAMVHDQLFGIRASPED